MTALRNSNFRRFLIGTGTSLLGDCAAAPAIALAVLARTGSAGALGAVLAARVIPVVALLLVGGVLGDRWSRRTMMISADLVRCAVQATMAALLAFGPNWIWPLILLQALAGAATAMFTPGITGFIRQICAPEELASGNGLRGIVQSLALIAGPLCAAGLVVTVGAQAAVGLDALSFGVSALCLARIKTVAMVARPPGHSMARDLVDGWHEFTARRWVWATISVASVANLSYATFCVLGPVLARQRHQPGTWPLLLSAFGVGAVCGAALATQWRPARPLRTGLLMVCLFAAQPFAMALAGGALPVVLGGFAGGLGLMTFNPMWETTLQRHVPTGVLSRISAYEWFGSYLGQPIGYLTAASFAAHIGIRNALLTIGVVQVVTSLVPLFARDVRELPAEPASDKAGRCGLPTGDRV